MEFELNLQRFAEEGTGAAIPDAAGAETAPAAESTTGDFTVNAGDSLANGQVVSSQVAAEMNRQMARHPELRKTYGQSLKRGQAGPAADNQAAGQDVQGAEKSIEDRWNEAKKGEFADLYGRDVASAVQERFKNQKDAKAELDKLGPMLNVLMERAGVKSVDDLVNHVMDDDSLYEEAAEEAGMSVAAFKQFKALEAQRDEALKREQQSMRDQMLQKHFSSLAKQAEEMKKQFPDFDLQKELKNEKFFKLTTPEVGISVRDAYFAIHHDELAPQMMAYGMERAKQQMGQTLQAQRRRPAEGAMKAQPNQAADFNVDIRAYKPSERRKIYDLIHKGKMTWG